MINKRFFKKVWYYTKSITVVTWYLLRWVLSFVALISLIVGIVMLPHGLFWSLNLFFGMGLPLTLSSLAAGWILFAVFFLFAFLLRLLLRLLK